jgi:MFS family permease
MLLLRNSGFFKLLAYRFQVVLAYQIIATVAGWHIYQLTHDWPIDARLVALGSLGLAEVIPYFCCALFAGHWVDRHSRRMFGVLACVAVSCNALLLLAAANGWLPGNEVTWIYAAIALGGVARAFLGPTYTALFALALPREQYTRGAGLGSSIFQTGLVLGPVLGGVLLSAKIRLYLMHSIPALGGILASWHEPALAYAVAAMLGISAAISLFSLRLKEPPPTQGEPVFSSIVAGLRFVFANQILIGAQALDMFAVLFGGAVSMLPVFIDTVYHTSPESLGILRAAPAIGAIATGIMLAHRPPSRHAGRLLLCAVAGFGACIILFALTPYFWGAALLLLLSGVCDGVSVVMRTTIMQLLTPDHMRGRVSAINGIFIGSSNELGAYESGKVAGLMGLIPSVIFGGAMSILIVGITAKFAPKLRRLDLRELQ